jgi:hypothetical protein
MSARALRASLGFAAVALVLATGASSRPLMANITLSASKVEAAYQFGDVSSGLRAYSLVATAKWNPETSSYEGYFDIKDLTDQYQFPRPGFGTGNTGGYSDAKVVDALFSAEAGHQYRITAHWKAYSPGGASAEEDSPVLILRAPKNEPVPRFTDDEKRDFQFAATMGYTHCLGAILLLGMVAAGPGALILIGVAAAFAGAGVGFTALSRDPVDSNFRVVAKPTFPPEPKITAGADVSERGAAAARKLLAIQMREIGFVRALQTALNRSQGAHVKKQTAWEKKQMQAAGRYAAQLAAALLADAKLRPSVVPALAGSEVATVRATDTIAFATERSFVRTDLPASIRSSWSSLHLTKEERDEIHAQIMAVDGSFYPRTAANVIADPKAVGALRRAAKSLQAFAEAAAKNPLETRPL